MYYDFLVRIPENTGRITVNRRGDTTYIDTDAKCKKIVAGYGFE